MSREVEIKPCQSCGEPKRIDTWCASAECADRVAELQEIEREERAVWHRQRRSGGSW